MKKSTNHAMALLLASIMALCAMACGAAGQSAADSAKEAASEQATLTEAEATTPASQEAQQGEAAQSASQEAGQNAGQEAQQGGDAQETSAEKNGDIYILFTSDVHCGVEQGFGYAGLQQVRDTLDSKGYETILVDDGDSIQGEAIGTLSKGETMIDLMNDVGYDVAIPGNHEFDYGTDRFLELVKKANFPYISCNFSHNGELVLEPYVIKEAAGRKIGFVGITTPLTFRGSTPTNFQDENGEFVYDFLQTDQTGELAYKAVQDAVDAARADGAEFVYLISHLGNEEECRPWTYADVIANTTGIDVVLDGHSHDTDQVDMKNKDGEKVTRSAVGTKMACIGYSCILADKGISETGIWSWPNKTSAPELLNIQNEMRGKVSAAGQAIAEEMGKIVAHTTVELTIYDPVEKDNSGNPIRMVRRGETNLGDLCADAYRSQSGADIALLNGGAIRVSIPKGDITYGNIIAVNPFGNELCVREMTGQQILDALEWGARTVPSESGAFPQVSGLTYEINVAVDSPCKQDKNGIFAGIEGERRVRNVMVGEEPLDPDRTYSVAGQDYMLLKHGDGYGMFDEAPVLKQGIKLDNQVLIDYIVETLGGDVGEEYADPYGQGRIVIVE